MDIKIASWQGYGNRLLNQVFPDFEMLVEKVEAVTASTHPTSHEFVESQEFPGTCGECDWIDPATETDCSCSKTLAEHVKAIPTIVATQNIMVEVVVVIPSSNKGGRLH